MSCIRPCDINGGMSCKQCNRRITGTHVASVMTRTQKRQVHSDSSQEGVDDQGEGSSSGKPPKKVRTRKASKREKKTSLLNRFAPQAVSGGAQDWSSEFLAQEQRKDPEIGQAVEWATTGQRPTLKEVEPRGSGLCALWRQCESLVLKDNVLCRIFHKTDGTADICQTIMPFSLKPSFMALIHGDSAAHLKFNKSAEHLARRA